MTFPANRETIASTISSEKQALAYWQLFCNGRVQKPFGSAIFARARLFFIQTASAIGPLSAASACPLMLTFLARSHCSRIVVSASRA